MLNRCSEQQFESDLTMENVANCAEKINSVLASLQDVDISSTARLIAVLEAFGITDRAEVEKLTASKPSTVREARRTLEIQRQKSSGDGNPAPEIQRCAGFPAQAPESQRQKSSERQNSSATLVCPDVTTRANIELPTEVLIPSEVKEVSLSEVSFVSPKAQPKKSDRGSRLPNDFSVPTDWIDWTRTNCPRSTPETAAVEALKFTNYWTSLAGAKARKTDWRKTWQNWCLSNFSGAPLRPAVTVGPSKIDDAMAALNRRKAREAAAQEAIHG